MLSPDKDVFHRPQPLHSLLYSANGIMVNSAPSHPDSQEIQLTMSSDTPQFQLSHCYCPTPITRFYSSHHLGVDMWLSSKMPTLYIGCLPSTPTYSSGLQFPAKMCPEAAVDDSSREPSAPHPQTQGGACGSPAGSEQLARHPSLEPPVLKQYLRKSGDRVVRVTNGQLKMPGCV